MTDIPTDLQEAAYHLQRFLQRNQVNGKFVRVTIELDTRDNRFRAEAGAARELDVLSAEFRCNIRLGRFQMHGVGFKFTDEQERTRW